MATDKAELAQLETELAEKASYLLRLGSSLHDLDLFFDSSPPSIPSPLQPTPVPSTSLTTPAPPPHLPLDVLTPPLSPLHLVSPTSPALLLVEDNNAGENCTANKRRRLDPPGTPTWTPSLPPPTDPEIPLPPSEAPPPALCQNTRDLSQTETEGTLPSSSLPPPLSSPSPEIIMSKRALTHPLGLSPSFAPPFSNDADQADRCRSL
jgi:hypothetical protein